MRSIDLRTRKGVKAIDVRRNTLTGRQISERKLDAESLAPIAGEETVDCDPSPTTTFVDCAQATLRLNERSRLLVIATGNEESIGAPAQAICEVRIDNDPQALPIQPGEEATDNTSGTATNGFARTVVTEDRLPPGRHKIALACKEFTGNVRIDAPTIAAIAIGSR